jgi:membrane fusion protein, multidrug efflux system
MRDRVLLAMGIAGLAAAGGCARVEPAAGERPPVAVEEAAVVAADLPEAVEVVGSLGPKFAAEIKSEYSGIVAAVHVTEWVPVRRGQALATLDTREASAALAAAEAALRQAEVAKTRAVREHERAEKLKQVGLMTQQGLEDAQTAREAAAAASTAAGAQLAGARTRLAKTVVRAPFDGVVAFRGVDVGDRVESMGGGEAMFQVIDPRLLELTMAVPSARLAGVRVGQEVEFTVDALPGRTFMGRLTHINPAVDPLSRAGKVVADVPNEAGTLKGGLFAKGWIRTGSRAGVVQVPRAALQGWDVEAGTAFVFVIQGGVAQRRDVRTGAASGERVEVTSGLEDGERVATRGAFNLRPGDRVKPVAAPAA